MALVSVKEQAHLNRSRRELQQASGSRYFMVIFDALTGTQPAEAAVAAVVALGSVFPGDESLARPRVAQSIEARAEGEAHGTHFTVQVDYSDQYVVSPLDQPADISWDFADATQTYFLDHSSTPKPVCNSAGDPFEQLLERETGNITATVKKNVGTTAYSPGAAVAIKDHTNSDSFTIDGATIAAGQAKFKAWTVGGVQIQNGVFYRVATQTLQFRASWDDVIDDRGYREKNGAVAGKVKPVDATGTAPLGNEKPWPLDGSGAAKANSTDAPAQLTFKPYATAAFSGTVYA